MSRSAINQILKFNKASSKLRKTGNYLTKSATLKRGIALGTVGGIAFSSKTGLADPTENPDFIRDTAASSFVSSTLVAGGLYLLGRKMKLKSGRVAKATSHLKKMVKQTSATKKPSIGVRFIRRFGRVIPIRGK